MNHAKSRKTAKSNAGGLASVGKIVEANNAVAALVMKGANFPQKLIAYALYVIFLAGLVALVNLRNDPTKQLMGLGSVVVPALILSILVLRRYHDLSRTKTLMPPETRERRPENLQLSQVVYDRIRATLAEARKDVFEFLHAREPELLDDQVRANIFVPVYGSSGGADDYVLSIYQGLHFKMDLEPERMITFKPKQGCTGRVFDTGKAMVAVRLDSSSGGGWDETYNITPDLEDVIHPELKWIISLPLKGDGGSPIGVMNIDGLCCSKFKVDTLYDCIPLLTQYVIIISGFMMGK